MRFRREALGGGGGGGASEPRGLAAAVVPSARPRPFCGPFCYPPGP